MITAAVLTVAFGPASAVARSNSPPPLYDAVFLNTGFVCRWDVRCMDRQQDAMKHALKYVRKKNPPTWRVELCNRNAGKHRDRVDWVGFDHCIRNETLRPPPPPPPPVRKTRPQPRHTR